MFLYRREEDYSELGRAVCLKAKELLHQKHLSGQFDQSLEDTMQEASKIVCAELVKTVKKIQEGKNGTEKTVTEIDERVAGKQQKNPARARTAGRRRTRT
jgi:hypothetical protein